MEYSGRSAASVGKCLTRRLRGIHAAWHFWYAVSFSGESGLRKVGLGGIHPLTRRYALIERDSRDR
ncbi:TPA: DUF3265 domain-containing protein [Vibrio vulnificus]|nr:DUF3265 domain-containing protein [Vibrio vulnificus]HDY7498445.1 DUF3265 domain-containing protein [Vibrio vulnificus]